MSNQTSSPVFVALDVPTQAAAVDLAQRLAPHVGGFKIGLELFTSCGPRIVEEIGAPDVFLDLKFHDIPNTVAGCSRAAARMGVKIFNVHCLGGSQMMRAA
jgi:orotidine-5'-phosphate decarboxylase